MLKNHLNFSHELTDKYFKSFNEEDLSIIADFGGPKWKKRPSNVIDNVAFDKIIRSIGNIDKNDFKNSTIDSIRALRLIRAFRFNGHLIANLDPLGLMKREYLNELNPLGHGFKKEDLNKKIYLQEYLDRGYATLEEIITFLSLIHI